jgi:hypothetical protein
MKQILRRGIECMPAPLPVLARDSFRYLRYPRLRREWRVKRHILGELPGPLRVMQGPFRGMRYIPMSAGSIALPKLLGTYERELNPAIEEICRAGCDRIVDIGAAEGYYAVGMALRNPGVPLTCFEMNPSERYYLRRMAACNGVLGRVVIAGECTPEALDDALVGAGRPVVICDCEGAEDVLLDPRRVPGLRRAWIVVEVHETMVAGVEQRLRERFAPTHDIEAIRDRPRTPGDLPGARDLDRDAGLDLTEDEAALAMDEHRSGADWLFLRVKAG